MKLTKAIIGSLCIPAIVVPMTTLTSCSQGWGNATPFAIGGLDASPYKNFSGNILDYDGENMLDYLQSSYAVQSGNGFYAYTAPMKFTEGTEKTPGTWNIGETGWYTSSDGNLNPTAKDKYKDPDTDSQAVSNARNAALSSNIDFIGTIGNTIGSYLDLALQYQASQLNEDDKEMKDITYAWGGEAFALNHGKKGGTDSEKTQNNDFIEFILALSNLIGTKAVNALFKTSQVNFTFNASGFPLPSYKGKKAGISPAFYELINGSETTLCKDSKYWNGYPNKPKVDTEKTKVDGKDKEFKYRAYEYKNVPVVINFNSLTKTYVNPRIKNKFLVNDVYSSKDQILSSVDKQWDKIMPKFADPDIRESKTKPMYSSYELDTSSSIPVTAQNIDARLPELHGNDFIALVDYVVYAYDQDDGIDEDNPTRNKAIISGVSNFFPAYFVSLYNDMFVKIKDTDLYVFSKNAVNNHNSDLLGLLNRTSKDGKKAHARDVEHKELLTFLGYLFGSDATTINTSTFFNPVQIK